MNFKVHFILGNDDCTAEVNAVNGEAAAKQIRKEYTGAIVKKTKLVREKETA